MLVRVYQRRATATEWASANPILAEGEIALEKDTDSFKIGDGSTRWNDLSYASGQSAYSSAVQNGFTGTEAEWIESLTGYGIAVENGYTGTQEEWLESLTGYGIAVQNGFTGTQQDWLDSLVGDQGETGPQGAGLLILGSFSDVSELPLSGDVGDAYVINTDLYIWTGSLWENAGPLGTTAIVSDTSPAGAVTEGTIWFDPSTGSTYIYVNDGDSSQWIQTNGSTPIAGTLDGGTPFD